MVEGSAGRLLVKCGGPSAKGDPSLKVDQARVATEAAVMALAHAAAPAHSPALVLHDPAAHTLAVEFLEGRETLTQAVARGAVHPSLARHAGAALAAVGVAGAPGALGTAAHAELAATLADSDSVAGIVEQFALYEPFDPDDASGRKVRRRPSCVVDSWTVHAACSTPPRPCCTPPPCPARLPAQVPPGLEAEVEGLLAGHPGFQAEIRALRRLLRRPPGGAACATVVHQDIWGRWARRSLPPVACTGRSSVATHPAPNRSLRRRAPFSACSNILVAASGPPSTHIIDWRVQPAALACMPQLCVRTCPGCLPARAACLPARRPACNATPRSPRPPPRAGPCRELALLGHSLFDMGHLFGTLMMSALCARGLGEAGDAPEARPAQEAWLAAGVAEGWEAYWAVRRERGPPAGLPCSAADERALLPDALGFAGAVLLRWTVGQFNIAEVMGLQPGTPPHTAAVRRAVHLGSALVRLRRRVPSAAAAADMLRAALADAPVEAAAALVPEEAAVPLPPEALPPSKAQMLRGGRSLSCKLSSFDLGRLSQRFMRTYASKRVLLEPPAE